MDMLFMVSAFAFLLGSIIGFGIAFYFFYIRSNSFAEETESEEESFVEEITLKDVYDKVVKSEENTGDLGSQINSIYKSFTSPIEQGQHGEDLLKLVFEGSGLIEGEQYIYNRGTAEGRPDYIVKLPNKGAVIVDAKFNSRNFTRAYETDDLDERENLFQQSANDVEKTAKELSSRTYTNIEGIDTAEMIFMFLPNDNIYANAVNKKENLLEQCYKGFPVGNQSNKTPIILVTPSSLASSLKVVSMMWKERNLYRNISDVKKSLKKLHQGFKTFNQNFVKGGKDLLSASDSFRKVYSKFSSLSDEIQAVEGTIDVVPIDDLDESKFMIHKTQKPLSAADIEKLEDKVET